MTLYIYKLPPKVRATKAFITNLVRCQNGNKFSPKYFVDKFRCQIITELSLNFIDKMVMESH